MVFNEIENFIEVCNNSVIELKLVLWSDWSPHKLGDQIPTNKHCIRSMTYNYCITEEWAIKNLFPNPHAFISGFTIIWWHYRLM